MGQNIGLSEDGIAENVKLLWENVEPRSEKDDFPGVRYKHTLEVISKYRKMLLLGGDYNSQTYFVLDLDNYTWKKKKALIGVGYHTSCLFSNHLRTYIVLCGGWMDGRKVNQNVYEIDVSENFETWKLVKTKVEKTSSSKIIPLQRYASTTCVSPRTGGDREEMVLFGGDSANIGRKVFENDLWLYDCKKRSWKLVECASQSVPPKRAYHTMVAVQKERKIYVSGGDTISRSYSRYHGDLWCYSFDSKRWNEIRYDGQDKMLPRAAHTLTVLGNEDFEETGLLVGMGGYTNVKISEHSKESLISFWYCDLRKNEDERCWRGVCCDDQDIVLSSYSITQVGREMLIYGGFSRLLPKERVVGMKFRDINRQNHNSLVRIEIPLMWYQSDDERERIEFLKEYLLEDVNVMTLKVGEICKTSKIFLFL